MIEESFATYLPTDSGVAAHTGNGDRVFGGMAPQNTPTPYLVYSKAGNYPQDYTYCGPDQLARCVFQFDSYAKTYKESILLAKALKGALLNFHGDMAGTHISSVSLETEFQLVEQEPGLFRVSTTLLFWYTE